jgi:hypothetical protein
MGMMREMWSRVCAAAREEEERRLEVDCDMIIDSSLLTFFIYCSVTSEFARVSASLIPARVTNGSNKCVVVKNRTREGVKIRIN